jgi:hypothetical protein
MRISLFSETEGRELDFGPNKKKIERRKTWLEPIYGPHFEKI